MMGHFLSLPRPKTNSAIKVQWGPCRIYITAVGAVVMCVCVKNVKHQIVLACFCLQAVGVSQIAFLCTHSLIIKLHNHADVKTLFAHSKR